MIPLGFPPPFVPTVILMTSLGAMPPPSTSHTSTFPTQLPSATRGWCGSDAHVENFMKKMPRWSILKVFRGRAPSFAPPVPCSGLHRMMCPWVHLVSSRSPCQHTQST